MEKNGNIFNRETSSPRDDEKACFPYATISNGKDRASIAAHEDKKRLCFEKGRSVRRQERH
jgi:hypothetical protein